MGDFPAGIVEQVAHRPYPLPREPWIMTQSWHDLLFAHWPVAVDELRALVPPGLELELFDRQAWVGTVSFQMTNVSPRGVPALPWVSAFPELNVRTYVRVGDRPGVYFFSLDAGNPLAVAAARALFKLPYFLASMEVGVEGDRIRYASRRSDGSAEFVATYAPTGPRFTPVAGSLEYFLTERYCLYTVGGSSHLYRVDIHHEPWVLQAADAEVVINTMAAASRIRVPSVRPLLHFARRQDALAFPLIRVKP